MDLDNDRGVSELGEFLRSRRARVTPDQVGLVSYGARRVPGLRREELAMLAGVSATYYTRLEQGQSTNASESVLDAVANALNLEEDERIHLHDLAKPTPPRQRRPRRPESARPGLRRLLDAMGEVPAVIVGRGTEVLAWNPLAHALLAGHCDYRAPERAATRPNLTRMLFLDPHTRELHSRWDEETSRAVASLRLVAGRYKDDLALAELVGQLSMNSSRFATLWSKHPVHNCVSGTKYLHHPQVGELELGFEVMAVPDRPGQRLITYTAAPGTASASALALLRTIAYDSSASVLGPTPGAGIQDRQFSNEPH
jgi:transcriptional regulator with XRE-family HTH domain